MIKIDNPSLVPRIGGLSGKAKGPKPRSDTQELRNEQGLCLRCGEVGHYAAARPRMGGSFALAKDSGRKKPDTPLKKGPAKPKTQRVLQFEGQLMRFYFSSGSSIKSR
ncbi:UNVERIFIED_CONTAM: hypothetical protein K2H54_042490 [Gekko kuhli]